jgi:hypothetical protein|tara:strand:+ start:272 stop:517 length:246 start_codon:yes stop_codon:yes gene_type:complete
MPDENTNLRYLLAEIVSIKASREAASLIDDYDAIDIAADKQDALIGKAALALIGIGEFIDRNNIPEMKTALFESGFGITEL